MKVIKVGLLGMGTVGSGVFEVLKNNAAEISRRAGCTIQIVASSCVTLRKSASWWAPTFRSAAILSTS